MHSYRACLQNTLSSSTAPGAPLAPCLALTSGPDSCGWEEEDRDLGWWRDGGVVGFEQKRCRGPMSRLDKTITLTTKKEKTLPLPFGFS